LVNTGVWVQQTNAVPAQPLTVYWIAEGRLLDFGLVHGEELSEGIAASYYAALGRAAARGLRAPERITVALPEVYAAVASVTPPGTQVVYQSRLDFGLWEDEVLRASRELSERAPPQLRQEEAEDLDGSLRRLWENETWDAFPPGAVFTVSAPAWGIPFGGLVLLRSTTSRARTRAIVLFRERWAAEQFAAGARHPSNHLVVLSIDDGHGTPRSFAAMRNQQGAVFTPEPSELRTLRVILHGLAHFLLRRENLVAGDALLANRFALGVDARSGTVDLYLEDESVAHLGARLFEGEFDVKRAGNSARRS
jgi:hypothetical protein